MDLPSEIKKLEETIKSRSAEKAELLAKLNSVEMAICEAMGAIQAFEAVRQRGVNSDTIITGV